MRDLRLYYYRTGTLHKYTHRTYKYSDIEELKRFVNRVNDRCKMAYQWVVVEYFSPYNSKIIEII